MNHKKKEELPGQLQFELFSKKPGSFLDNLEDIFDKRNGSRKEEDKEKGIEARRLLRKACIPKKWKITEKGKHYLEKHSSD